MRILHQCSIKNKVSQRYRFPLESVIDSNLAIQTGVGLFYLIYKNVDLYDIIKISNKLLIFSHYKSKRNHLNSFCTWQYILGETPSQEKKEYWNGDIPCINSGKMNLFRIIEASECSTNEVLSHSSTKVLPKKTTIIAIIGTSLGQICLLEIDACAFNTFKICKFQFISHNNKIKKHKTRKENKPYA